MFSGSLRATRIVGPGVLVALVTMVLFAVLTVALAAPIQEHGWLPVILGSRLTNTLVGVALLAIALRDRDGFLGPLLGPPGGLSRRAVALVVLAGVFDLLGFVAYTIGLEVSETWLVGLASSFGPALVVLIAVAFLGRAAAAVAVAGAGDARRGAGGAGGLGVGAVGPSPVPRRRVPPHRVDRRQRLPPGVRRAAVAAAPARPSP